MRQTCILAPSILSADFTRLGEQIAEVESAGADWLHVDVMDGHFVPNLTLGPVIVEACRRATKLPLDVHLMIEAPERLLEAFAKAGASRLIVHVETCPDLIGILRAIKALHCSAGVTLNPDTPASAIIPGLKEADQVLVMTVHPGYSGQEFIPEVLSKVVEIRHKLDQIHSSARLEVDGGISAATISRAREAGADAFVAASAIFQHPDGITAGMRLLRKLCQSSSKTRTG
jgi:ribulose-phosphate 3-epimerase